MPKLCCAVYFIKTTAALVAANTSVGVEDSGPSTTPFDSAWKTGLGTRDHLYFVLWLCMYLLPVLLLTIHHGTKPLPPRYWVISEDSQQRCITHQNYRFDTMTMTASVPIATAPSIWRIQPITLIILVKPTIECIWERDFIHEWCICWEITVAIGAMEIVDFSLCHLYYGPFQNK